MNERAHQDIMTLLRRELNDNRKKLDLLVGNRDHPDFSKLNIAMVDLEATIKEHLKVYIKSVNEDMRKPENEGYEVWFEKRIEGANRELIATHKILNERQKFLYRALEW